MLKKFKMYTVIILAFALILSMTNNGGVKATTLQPNYPGNDQWNLVFEDNFNGNTLDTSKWSIRGKEYANYHHESCTTVEDGKLVLRIDKEPSGQTILGRVDTAGLNGNPTKFEQKYGFFECRADVPPTEGTYFAFWMNAYPGMGNVDGTGRDGAEIDICETANKGDYTESAVHWDGYGASHQSVGSGNKYAPNLHDGYHIYGLEWDANTLRFYFDGQQTWSYSGVGVPRIAEQVILSSGGGSWVEGNINNAQLPYFAKVDWVRVYEKEVPNQPTIINSGFETGNAQGWDINNSAAVVSGGKTGSYAARLTTNGWFEQTVTGLKPNTDYKMKVWVKTNTEPRFLIHSMGNPSVRNTASDTNGQYVQHELAFSTGDATTARLCYYHWNCDGETYADDFEIVEVQ